DKRVNCPDQHAANRRLDEAARLLCSDVWRKPRQKYEHRCRDHKPLDRTPEIERRCGRWRLSLYYSRHYSTSSIRTAVSMRPARPSRYFTSAETVTLSFPAYIASIISL